MSYRSTREAVDDLRRHGRLIELAEPLSPNLEIAEVQRRVYARGGPAVLFTNPIGTRFPMLGNLFGSIEQARFLFRHTLDRVRQAIECKIDPSVALKKPWKYAAMPWIGWTMLPKRVRSGQVLKNRVAISQLPQLVSWPEDGGSFVTLPQVLSQLPSRSTSGFSWADCNLGMYRVQLNGNEYVADEQVGLHYQIHRGIGVHHQAALSMGEPLRVAICIGGSPAMTLAAVMPLPERMSELTFAGALAGHRIPIIASVGQAPIYADADFVIVGEVDLNSLKPEGPFGDHLGYYSKQHPFPWLQVQGVYHRPNAIWPFTVVGRPPQEDTTFGQLIHELTGPIIPTVIPGVRQVHAVDAAGVHPLLLAIGSERYTPYQKNNSPQELLTQANAILGQGQMSLAKYLFIVNAFDQPNLDIHDIKAFLLHWLERVDWRRDLHFQTKTTIDTLDYSGEGLNQGSKVVVPATGMARRKLSTNLPTDFQLPTGFDSPSWLCPGILLLQGPSRIETASNSNIRDEKLEYLIEMWDALFQRRMRSKGISPSSHGGDHRDDSIQDSWPPLIVLVDDADFAARSLENFLWVTFTRSNPASDIHGVGHFIENKHWGCRGSLIIDAHVKPWHAPPLIESPAVAAKIDALAARGGPIAKFL